jgi:hypothetical protein
VTGNATLAHAAALSSLSAPRHDLQGLIRQRPLQRVRLIPWPVFGAILDAKDHGGLMSVHPNADAAQIQDPDAWVTESFELAKKVAKPA